jgi:hypothetical protein
VWEEEGPMPILKRSKTLSAITYSISLQVPGTGRGIQDAIKKIVIDEKSTPIDSFEPI